MFHGESVKMCEDLTPNFGDKKLPVATMTLHSYTSFSTRELSAKYNMTVTPQPSYSPDWVPCAFPISCNSDTTEVMEMKLQTVVNALTEYYFQDALRDSRSTGNRAYLTN
jgi:hypothetical protein